MSGFWMRMRNLSVFGTSDIPIATIKLNAIVQCFLPFSLKISLNSSLKTQIAALVSSSIAFSHDVRKLLTSKQISNPSGNTNLPGNLLATSTYQLLKYMCLMLKGQ